MSILAKRALVTTLLAMVVLLLLPMTVQAAPAILSFHMDRTTFTVGQTINISVQTTYEATFVFAETGGSPPRVTATGGAANADGIRTWNLVITPEASTTRINIHANTSNSTLHSATLSIPVSVTQAGTTTPGTPGTIAPLQIVSVREIDALAVNQVRLEVVTGSGATNVWVHHSGNSWPQGVRVSGDANTQTWHVTLRNIAQWNQPQSVQVSANTGFFTGGATNLNHTITFSHIFVPPPNPQILLNPTANPASIHVGESTTLQVMTNAEVGFVWAMVDGNRRDGTLIAGQVAGTRTWSIPNVSPNATGNIVVHANTTNTATGAVTRNVHVTVEQTRVIISHASATWAYTGGTRTGVRLIVHTNMYATNVSVSTGTRNMNMTVGNRTRSGNTWIWEETVAMTDFSNSVPIQIRATDWGNVWLTTGNDAWATINPGVGGVFNQGTAQHHGAIWNTSVNPNVVHRDTLWPIEVTFTTANDVTEVRIRDANMTLLSPSVTAFTEGANDTRIWTIRNLWPTVGTDATSIPLTVEIRRGTAAWISVPAITVPVMS